MAEAAYYGLGDTLEDIDEALLLYLQANKLGAPLACLRIGQIYKGNERLKNPNQALVYFKEGVKRGFGECYAEMGSIFLERNELENFRKCWAMYFESDSFRASTHNRALYGYTYLLQAKQHRLKLDHWQELFRMRDEILKLGEETLDYVRKKHGHAYEGDFRFMRLTLYPELTEKLANGRVKSFDRARGYGVIWDSKRNHFSFQASDLIDDPSLFREGLAVEFEIGEEWACNIRVVAEEPSFTRGEYVRILSGPFNGFTGQVDEINTENGMLKVMATIFGRLTLVELNFLDVERLTFSEEQ
jgi:hypothetical protein